MISHPTNTTDRFHLAFSADESEKAHEAWGCNCGPGALAACIGWTLDAIRPHLATFEAKRYLNSRDMADAIASTGHRHHATASDDPEAFPTHGLVLVQWAGPWLNPGVPYAARLRATHWIASKILDDGLWVFDINAGWLSFEEWESWMVPKLVAATKRATGEWSVNRSWEVRKGR
jgi:hypothetical protein